MVRPEPFRAMIEQAMASDTPAKPAARTPPPKPAPMLEKSGPKHTKIVPLPATTNAVAVALEKRLDQLDLPASATTPARGMRVPLRLTAAVEMPFDIGPPPPELAALTKKLELPPALGALLQDAVAAA